MLFNILARSISYFELNRLPSGLSSHSGTLATQTCAIPIGLAEG